MNRTLHSVENGYRLCILGNLNGWTGYRTRVGIIGAFGVLGEDDNSRRVLEFYKEMDLCVGNILSTELCISTQEWEYIKTE